MGSRLLAGSRLPISSSRLPITAAPPSPLLRGKFPPPGVHLRCPAPGVSPSSRCPPPGVSSRCPQLRPGAGLGRDMPSNVEVKAKVSDPTRFAEKAAGLSQSEGTIIRQHDTFFNCSRGRLKLRDFMTVLSDALGVKGEVRKERRLFLIGQTRVHLDAVEGLGHYMELEVTHTHTH